MPLGVKLEFGIDGLCRSLIRKMGLCLFVLNPVVYAQQMQPVL